MNRTAEVTRKTRETRIRIWIDLDGKGESSIKTGIGFFDHMLETLARHSFVDLKIESKGDLHVDEHHSIEDVGLCLGEAVRKAVGDKKGIRRFGWALCPMDDALARAALDLSGRPYFVCDCPMNLHRIGSIQAESITEFFRATAVAGGMTLHLDLLRGNNLHHGFEALFKAFAKALGQAVSFHPKNDAVPSTKGVL